MNKESNTPNQYEETPPVFAPETRTNYTGEALPDVMRRWRRNIDRRHKPFYQYFIFCKPEEKTLLLEYVSEQLGLDQGTTMTLHAKHANSILEDLREQASDIVTAEGDTTMVIVDGYGDALQNFDGETMSHDYNQNLDMYGDEEDNPYRAAGKHLVIVTVINTEEEGYEKAKVDVTYSQFADGKLELV